MKWSYRLFRAFGIDVQIHASFILLLTLIVLTEWLKGGAVSAVTSAAVILLLFGFVLLHEFGHSLMARRFGVPVYDITLLPIGGMARLGFIPTRPGQELLIAIAGPAVNLALALLFLFLSVPATAIDALPHFSFTSTELVLQLLVINVALFLFNLVPAFPMDGGRVLRALLAIRLDYLRATRIAANVGRVICVILFVTGILSEHYMLCLVAFFIFVGAGVELRMVEHLYGRPKSAPGAAQSWGPFYSADQPVGPPGHPEADVPGEPLPPQDLRYRYEELRAKGEAVVPVYSADGRIIAIIRELP